MSKSLVSPDLTVKDFSGYCLRFTQSVWGAPVAHPTAWAAWEATTMKHETRDLPDVPVPIWFDWTGDIGSGVKRYGHAATWVPGQGVFTSPPSGYGNKWYPTLEAQERAYGIKFVGWSEDINTLRVAEFSNTPTPTRKKKQMGAFYRTPDGSIYYQDKPNTAFTGLILPTWLAYEANGAKYYEISESDMNVLLGKYGTY